MVVSFLVCGKIMYDLDMNRHKNKIKHSITHFKVWVRVSPEGELV